MDKPLCSVHRYLVINDITTFSAIAVQSLLSPDSCGGLSSSNWAIRVSERSISSYLYKNLNDWFCCYIWMKFRWSSFHYQNVVISTTHKRFTRYALSHSDDHETRRGFQKWPQWYVEHTTHSSPLLGKTERHCSNARDVTQDLSNFDGTNDLPITPTESSIASGTAYLMI